MQSNKIINQIFIVFYILLSTSPFFQAELRIFPELKLQEKRELFKRPPELLKLDSIKDFNSSLKYLSIYIDDQFGFRNYYIYFYNWINVKIFQSSPRESVLLGKEGWLFYDRIISEKTAMKDLSQLNLSDNTKKTFIQPKNIFLDYSIPDYLGLVPYSEKDLIRIKENIENLDIFFKKKNIRLLIFFVPNKHTVYPEYLPNWIQAFEKKESRMEQVQTYLKNNTKFKIVDTLKLLSSEKKDRTLYLKHDTHFNDYGSFSFYKIVNSEIIKSNLSLPPLSNLKIMNQHTSNGDLVDMIGLINNFQETVPKIVPDKISASDCNPNKEIESMNKGNAISQSCYITGNKSLPKIILYGDSFSEALANFLKEDSNKLYFFLTIKFVIEEKFIDTINPDIVILEIAERGIDKLKTIEINLLNK